MQNLEFETITGRNEWNLFYIWRSEVLELFGPKKWNTAENDLSLTYLPKSHASVSGFILYK